MNLETGLGKIKLSNPFIAASGTYGFGTEWQGLSVPEEFGAIVTKGIFIDPRKGNPSPRLAETSCGLLNSIGLEGPGLELFIDHIYPLMLELNTHCFVNINGETVEEYSSLAEKLAKLDGISGLEINVSCPNLQSGGMAYGIDPAMVCAITESVRQIYSGFLIVKLTPNITDIRLTAKAALDAKADALCIANTWLGMSIDVHRKTSMLGRDYGGYSGPAVKPLTLRLVHQVYTEFKCLIIGSGGIYNLFDCLEYFIAGAGALMLGTVNFIDPERVTKLKKELSDYLDRKQISLEELIGSYTSPKS